MTYQYDLLQRLVQTNAPHWQEASYFDRAGNLIQRDLSDSQDQIQYKYTYDNLYQLKEEAGPTSHKYSHDSLYNRTSKNEEPYAINETDFTYDALDRLIEVRKGQQATRYTYDSFHRRLKKTHEGKTTYYIYWQEDEIGALEGQKIKELRILGLGKGVEIGAAVAIELEGTSYIPLHDPYGNVVTLLNLEENVASNYRYTAFGEEQTEDTKSPWRYSSKRLDGNRLHLLWPQGLLTLLWEVANTGSPLVCGWPQPLCICK